jgi:hypothetical protein
MNPTIHSMPPKSTKIPAMFAAGFSKDIGFRAGLDFYPGPFFFVL